MMQLSTLAPWLGVLGCALSASAVLFSLAHLRSSEPRFAPLWWSVIVWATGVILFSLPMFATTTAGATTTLRSLGLALWIGGSVLLSVYARAVARSESPGAQAPHSSAILVSRSRGLKRIAVSSEALSFEKRLACRKDGRVAPGGTVTHSGWRCSVFRPSLTQSVKLREALSE